MAQIEEITRKFESRCTVVDANRRKPVAGLRAVCADTGGSTLPNQRDHFGLEGVPDEDEAINPVLEQRLHLLKFLLLIVLGI